MYTSYAINKIITAACQTVKSAWNAHNQKMLLLPNRIDNSRTCTCKKKKLPAESSQTTEKKSTLAFTKPTSKKDAPVTKHNFYYKGTETTHPQNVGT